MKKLFKHGSVIVLLRPAADGPDLTGVFEKAFPGRGQSLVFQYEVIRIWLEPPVSIHPTVAKAIAEFDAVIIGPGSFYTSLMPIFLVRGVSDALAQMKGPIILIANLLTEGRGMIGFTAADAVGRIEQAIRRNVDVVVINNKWPTPATSYARPLT